MQNTLANLERVIEKEFKRQKPPITTPVQKTNPGELLVVYSGFGDCLSFRVNAQAEKINVTGIRYEKAEAGDVNHENMGNMNIVEAVRLLIRRIHAYTDNDQSCYVRSWNDRRKRAVLKK